MEVVNVPTPDVQVPDDDDPAKRLREHLAARFPDLPDDQRPMPAEEDGSSEANVDTDDDDAT